jgi:hypothetical protein
MFLKETTMSDQGQTTVEKIKELPIMSGAVAVAGAGILTEAFNVGMFLFAAPLACAAVAVSGAVNAMDKKRSGLSRIFSAAAAVTGAVGAAVVFTTAGPEALGAFVVSLAAMTAAGAFNVAAYALRNKKLPFSISIKRDKPATPGV